MFFRSALNSALKERDEYKARFEHYRDIYRVSMNRRVDVEQILLDVARGKRPALTPEECRKLAFQLAGCDDSKTPGTPAGRG